MPATTQNRNPLALRAVAAAALYARPLAIRRDFPNWGAGAADAAGDAAPDRDRDGRIVNAVASANAERAVLSRA